MSNNKQSSIDWLQAIELERDLTLADWSKAKAMHKEECIKYYVDSTDYGDMGQHIRESFIQIAEKMYNKTFGE